ncbi:MAG: DUF4251 domain-containing protein [Sediminibacterium sp.]
MLYKSFTKAVLLFAFVMISAGALRAQDLSAQIKKTITDKQYVFTAQSYSSSSIPLQTLAVDYELRILGDSLKANLPYFGRSYTAQINVTDGGMKFTSTRFEYSAEEKKKGKWEITISPKDDRTVQKMFLVVYPDARAMLQVQSQGREPMSFTGYLSGK